MNHFLPFCKLTKWKGVGKGYGTYYRERERVSDAVLKCYELLILSLVGRVKRELYLYAEVLYRKTMSYWTKDIGRKWPLDMKQLLS